MSLLTGSALADALFALRLHPPDVERDPYDTGLSPWYGTPTTGQWRPWDQIQDVWHLVLRYHLDIIAYIGDTYYVRRKDQYSGRVAQHPYAPVDEVDIPTLIANVALWCHAQEEPCPQ